MHLSWGAGFFTPVRTKRAQVARWGTSLPATAPWPSVSVLMPVRNAEATIGAAIDSVLSQDYEGPVEIVVADGSDTAATADLVRRQLPNGETGRQPGTDHRIRIVRGRGGGGKRRGHRAVRRPRSFSTWVLARAVSTLRRTGAANVGGRATAGRHLVLHACGGDGDDHSLGTGGCALPTGRLRGPRRTLSSLACSGATRWRLRAVSILLSFEIRLRTQLALAGARRNGVVRSGARGHVPARAVTWGGSLRSTSTTADGSELWRDDIQPP